MGLFHWFSKEAWKQRAKAFNEAQALRIDAERQAAIANLRKDISGDPNANLLKVVDTFIKAHSMFTTPPPSDDQQGCAIAADVGLIGAALYLVLAENLVLIRESTSDVYGLSYYPASDKPSWPELAKTSVTLLTEAQEIARRAGVPFPSELSSAIALRAQALQALTPEAAFAEKRGVPIYEHFQHGGASTRPSPGYLGRAAIASKKLNPPCRYRTVGDFKSALSALPGQQHLFQLNSLAPAALAKPVEIASVPRASPIAQSLFHGNATGTIAESTAPAPPPSNEAYSRAEDQTGTASSPIFHTTPAFGSASTQSLSRTTHQFSNPKKN